MFPMQVTAAVVASYLLFGIAVIFNIDESIWAGVPRWQAILTWPLALAATRR